MAKLELLSRTIYDADGVQTNWGFNFASGYLLPEHVKAYYELASVRTQVTVTPAMLIGPNQLRIVPAVPAGAVLTIYRDTPKNAPLVDFVDRGTVSEVALDTIAKQSVFVAAESADSAATAATDVAVNAAASAQSAALATSVNASSAAASAIAAAGSASGAASAATAAVNAHKAELAASNGAALVGYQPAGVGAVATTVQAELRESVSVKGFGAVGDGVTDDTAALSLAVYFCKTYGKVLRLHAGTYIYSSLAGLDANNINIVGDGSNITVLKYTGTGDALVLGTAAGFKQGINISGFTVEGNANVDRIIVAKALARCQWTDINVREAKSASGIGFVFQGCMLSRFDSLVCSMDRQAMTNPPYEAFNIEALSPFGNSSNNTFTNLYAEGAGNVASTIEIGLRISGGDQNTFIGGSPESCGTWGLLLDTDCRYNTFIGMGFENLAAAGGDVADAGISNHFINCYSSEKFILQGRSGVIEGGYFERIQIDALSYRNRVFDVLVNGWATGAGGLFDSGVGTKTKNVYDADLAAFIQDVKPRFLAYASSTVTNQTGAGAQATVGFSEVYDDNNNFTSNTFTAPVTGRYQLNAAVSLDALSAAATLTTLRIVTSNRTYLQQKGINPRAGGLQDAISMSVVADMDAGDTATVTIQVDGMAGNTVSIIGNVATMWTTFSGSQV